MSLIFSQAGGVWLGGYTDSVSVFELVLNLSHCSSCLVSSLWGSGYSFQIALLQVSSIWLWTDFSDFDHTNWSQGEQNGSRKCLQIYNNVTYIPVTLKISQCFPQLLLVASAYSNR